MPENARDLEELIQRHSAFMTGQMTNIAKLAKSEEDVRHECNKLIDAFIRDAGLRIKGRHEYSIGAGRLDSKYQGVLLEYKPSKGPGRIAKNPPGVEKAVNQIKQRLKDFVQEEGYRPESLFGVCCDAETFIFARYREGSWQVEEPIPVAVYSVERLLRALISLGAQGYTYSPDKLAQDFGADSPKAQRGIKNLYEAINATKDTKAQTFFRQWKILFGEVCGYDVEGGSEKIVKLGDHYSICKPKPAPLLFAVHTYYAIFMKFMASQISSMITSFSVSPVKACIGAATSEKLRQEMDNLEQGGIWNQLKIFNFLEGDIFAWYLSAWDTRIAEAIWDMVKTFDQYDPATLSIDPAESRDLLKRLYQHLFPKTVRHDLGEYYTPDWLAELVLNEVGYDGNPDKRLLDPACGSGTFLVMAINRVKEWFKAHRLECGFGEKALVKKILNNVIGFDLNPLAVMTSKMNYLLAIRDLIKHAESINLPVYLCDSIMPPSEVTEEITLKGAKSDLWQSYNVMKIKKTSVGDFIIPKEIATKKDFMDRYANAITFCISHRYSTDDFIRQCQAENLPITVQQFHRELYKQLFDLEDKKENGIWARIIKNAFAPMYTEPVDFVVGNPPWINWQNLPEDYRQSTAAVWQRYELFPHKGYKAKLGGGKDDISFLMTYVAHDYYLKDNGMLGFLITQTVFKTKGGGEGFRRFQYKNKNGRTPIYLRPICVHDLSELQPFEAATNRTAIFICDKSIEPFSYPIPYHKWSKARARIYKRIDAKRDYHGPRRLFSFSAAEDLEQVMRNASIEKLSATPIDRELCVSPWLTAPKASLPGLRKIVGPSCYKAFEGSNSGGLNGAFWIQVIKKLGKGTFMIQNMHDIGKNKVKRVNAAIEPNLVYPLLRGRDVQLWHAKPSAFIILTNKTDKLAGIPESEMKNDLPLTFSYLFQFQDMMRKRSVLKRFFKPTDPFYSMYGVGPYTMAKWKVVWREQSAGFQAAVVGPVGKRPVIPDHKLMLVPCESADEAHYITALLNSSPSRLLVKSYGIPTQTSTHVLQYVSIPKFNAGNSLHQKLYSLSEKCHQAAAEFRNKELLDLESEVDQAAAQLWGLTAEELKAIGSALKAK